MFRKTWLVVLAILIALTSVGCGGVQNKTSDGSGEQGKFDAATVIKDLKGNALAEKIGKYLEDGDVDKAVAVGEVAMKKEPDNLAVIFNLSNAYYFQKDLLSMVKVTKKMEEMSPQNPMVLNQLAWALIESGENPAEGIKKVETAMKIVVESGRAVEDAFVDTHAYGLYKLGKKSEAIAEWGKIMPRVQNGEMYLHLGQALIETGKKVEARTILDKGLGFTKLQMKDVNLTKAELKHLEEVKLKIENYLKDVSKAKS
ncbi:MAG: hypothetical protein M0021_03410 [Clostridia bacterium]|nr:hypothetical protein [Clostridia bacterium]